MKTAMALMLLFCSIALAKGAMDIPAHNSDPREGGWTTLEGENLMKIPHLNAGSEMNWSYPFDYIPVMMENQSIKGIFWGKSEQAGSSIRVSVSRFDIASFLSAFQLVEARNTTDAEGSRARQNLTGDANFSLGGLPRGMYTIFVLDLNSSSVLSATPLLVTGANLTLSPVGNLTAGDFIKLKVNLSLPDKRMGGASAVPANASKIFAAIMMSEKDYENSSLTLATNGTREGLNSTLRLRDKSMQIKGLPVLSSDLLMQILFLLPSNSAAGMQESRQSGTEILLITDPEWEKGEYILTLAAYAPGIGLLAVKQETIEVT